MHRLVFPEGMTLRNRDIVERVGVTRHAWERFVERYIAAFCKEHAPSEQIWFINKLSECFRRAKQIQPSEEVKKAHQLSHDNRPVAYFKDEVSGICFIVSDSFRRSATIITVVPNL